MAGLMVKVTKVIDLNYLLFLSFLDALKGENFDENGDRYEG